MGKKKISLTVYIITLIFMIVIIAILGYFIIKNNDNNNSNNVNTTTAEVNIENVNNEISNISNEDSEKELQKVLEQYLYLYGLKDSGATILTRDNGRFPYALDFYKTYDELQNDLKESEEKIKMDYGDEKLYETSIKFSDYKSAMLNYMSEDLFEENFTICQKDIDGKLYVISSGGDGKSYDIINMTKDTDNSYNVEFKYQEGESSPTNAVLNVTFDKNDNGNYIVESCVFE